VEEGARQGQLLAHAVGVALNQLVGLVRQLEEGEEPIGPLGGDRRLDTVEVSHEGQELPSCELRVQVGTLGHVADTPLHLQGLLQDVEAGHYGGPPAGFEQAGQHADGGGLARAVGAEEAEQFAGEDGEVKPFDRRQTAVVLAQLFCFNHSRSSSRKQGSVVSRLPRAAASRGSDRRPRPYPPEAS